MSGALAFFGYFFLGIGPGITFFLFVIAPKSFLVLLTFCSTFYWLLTLLLISLIFRGFLPVSVLAGPYAGVLVASVVIQEGARYGLWMIHTVTNRVLDKHAGQNGYRYDLIDKLYVALGWGYGHGAAHVIFFTLSLLTITTGDGTWYNAQCPSMSIFLAGCLYALAFGMLLPSLMVIAFEGYQQNNYLHIVFPPLMHLVASLLTLINLRHNGCLITFPILLLLGALNIVYASQICWSKGPHVSTPVPVVPWRLTDESPGPDTDADETNSQTPMVQQNGNAQPLDSASSPPPTHSHLSTGAAATAAAAGLGAARRRPRVAASSQWPLVAD